MPQQFRRNGHAVRNILIAFEDLDAVPAQRARIDQVGDGFLDVGQRMFHAAREHMGQFLRGLVGLCNAQRRFRRREAALTFQGADLVDRASQGRRQFAQIDFISPGVDQVHHVDGQHDRNSDFDELRRQIQISFDVRAVDNVQDDIGLFLHQIPARDLFFQRVRRQ